MDHDYYEILGVSPDANLRLVKDAYLKRALECHPDRGGTHAQMILVNEAWEVLSNAVTRREYDELRAMRGGAAEKNAFAEEVKAARARASQYPRDWTVFQSWINRITQDVNNAEYGSTRFWGNLEIATVYNSISGKLFVFVGGVIGGIIGGGAAVVYFGWKPGVPQNPFAYSYRFGMGLALAGVVIGAKIGEQIHKSIRSNLATDDMSNQNEIRSKPHPSTGEPHKVVIACRNCGQNLRVPRSDAELIITCQKCQHRFPYQHDASSARVSCPHCSKSMTIAASNLSETLRCLACNREFTASSA